jgi:hypothetical protein
LGGNYNAGTGNYFFLYYKVAGASEGASYAWVWAAATRLGGTIATYRGDFDTADPIDVVSNTAYIVSNTTVRAASMTVSAVNSPLVFFGGIHSSSSVTYTKPTAPVDIWVEDVDQADDGTVSRFMREICHMIWTGSGASGNIDATASATITDKHAFAVALNPAAGGGSILPLVAFGTLGGNANPMMG